MQIKTDKEFDQYIRSIMENARQDAPDGMWEAIESRLPEPRKAPAVWWRRAGYAMAFAAAAVAAVFLVIKPSAPKTYETDNVISQVLTEEASRSSLLAESYERPSQPASEQPAVPLLGSKQAPSAAKAAAEPAPETAAPKVAEQVSEPAPEPSAAKPQQQVSEQETPAQDKPVIVEFKENPFATAEVPESSRRRTQLQINGLVGGNDASQMPFSHSLVMGAKAVDAAGTVISENTESAYGIPLSFGLGTRFYLPDRFSIGTGVTYSLLTRSFNGVYTSSSNERTAGDIRHSINYIGVPLNLYYDILDTDVLQFYVFGGGAAEKAISNKYVIKGESGPVNYSTQVKGLQWSAGLGLGVQFRLADHVGLYLDPSARYFFDCNQPKSIRTKKPFTFGFEAGLRFDL